MIDHVRELEGDEPVDDDADGHVPGDHGREGVLVEARAVLEPALEFGGAEAGAVGILGDGLEHGLAAEMDGNHLGDQKVAGDLLSRKHNFPLDGNRRIPSESGKSMKIVTTRFRFRHAKINVCFFFFFFER